MVDMLFDLEYVLRSEKGPLTLQENNVLLGWKAQASRDFLYGFGGGSIATWLVTHKLDNLLNLSPVTRGLHNLFRFNIALGAGAACGFWIYDRSLRSSVDHILSQEGSRLQRQLTNIILKKYHDDPWVLRHLSRHFYSEEVYDDSSINKPRIRWRARNSFGDPITQFQDDVSYSEGTDSKNDEKKTTLQPKQVYVDATGDGMENPFDFIFGLPGGSETIPHLDKSDTSSRGHSRKERRSRRRHRVHHQEESSDT